MIDSVGVVALPSYYEVGTCGVQIVMEPCQKCSTGSDLQNDVTKVTRSLQITELYDVSLICVYE